MKKQSNYFVEKREIDIKKMCVKSLSYWRFILVIGVIAAVIAGVIQYRADVAEAEANIQAQIDAANAEPATIESLSAALMDSENANVRAALNYRIQSVQKQNYLDESIWMNIDGYNEDVVYLTYSVDGEGSESVIARCNAYAVSTDMAGKVANALGTDTSLTYISELLSISDTDYKTYFTLKVIADSAEECSVLADYADDIMIDYANLLVGTYGEFSVNLTDRTSNVIVDRDQINYKYSYSNEITNTINSFNGFYNNFNDTQRQLLEMLYDEAMSTDSSVYDVADEAAQETEETVSTADDIDTTINVKPDVKMILVGFIAGLVIAFACIALCYTVSKNIHSAEEVTFLFGIPVMGKITTMTLGKKKAGLGIDLAIDKLNYTRKKYLSVNQQMKMIYSNILLYCKKQNITQFFLTGSEMENIPMECIEELKSQLAKAGITMEAGTSITYDAESLLKLSKIGSVVFIEVEDKSKCEEIAAELNLCMQNQIPVLGMVLVQK